MSIISPPAKPKKLERIVTTSDPLNSIVLGPSTVDWFMVYMISDSLFIGEVAVQTKRQDGSFQTLVSINANGQSRSSDVSDLGLSSDPFEVIHPYELQAKVITAITGGTCTVKIFFF